MTITVDMILLGLVLAGAAVLLITDLLRVDIVAMISMLSLAWMNIITPAEAFSGFSSNAALSVIGVMIIGLGVERSGLIRRIADPVVRRMGRDEKRLLGCVSLFSGGASFFLPNIGAAAIFLPVTRRIARAAGLHPSRLLMPMGFAILIGGTATMVGSGPMILLNDILNQAQLPSFHLFAPTLPGLLLLTCAILYFLGWGRRLLPNPVPAPEPEDPQQRLIAAFHLETSVFLYTVPEQSPLAGKTREEIQLWNQYRLRLLAISDQGDITHAPWRGTRFHPGQELAVSGASVDAEQFRDDFRLIPCKNAENFKCVMDPANAGFAEIIVMPGSRVTGKTFRQIAFRKTYDLEPVMMIRGETERRGAFADIVLKPGDIIIAYGAWEKIAGMKRLEDFTVPTPLPQVETVAGKSRLAGWILLAALTGVIAGVNLPLVLLTGATAMILTGVIRADDAYRSVDWRTVFLMAGLIPLGLAMEKTGAAALIAQQCAQLLDHRHPLIILLVIGALASFFSLFISNVAATVLLAPIAINIALHTHINPAAAALLTAICSANSFILPTNQVNAFLMAPGQYATRDYLRVGAPLSLIFLLAITLFFWLLF